MHRRLVAIGRAAAAYGKFQAARESFAAAGQWVELMPLCALQGDFDALRDYAARVAGTQVGLTPDSPCSLSCVIGGTCHHKGCCIELSLCILIYTCNLCVPAV